MSQGVFDITAYGAVGDGSHDDTPAFVAALDAATLFAHVYQNAAMTATGTATIDTPTAMSGTVSVGINFLGYIVTTTQSAPTTGDLLASGLATAINADPYISENIVFNAAASANVITLTAVYPGFVGNELPGYFLDSAASAGSAYRPSVYPYTNTQFSGGVNATARFGADVYLPPGAYKLTTWGTAYPPAPINVARIYLRGEAGFASHLMLPAGNGLEWAHVAGGGIIDLDISHFDTATADTLLLNDVQGVTLENVSFEGCLNAIHATDGLGFVGVNCSINLATSGAGMLLDGYSINGAQNVMMTNCNFGGPGSPNTRTARGLDFQKCGGVVLTACQFLDFYNGLRLSPIGGLVSNVTLMGCQFDGLTSHGVLCQPQKSTVTGAGGDVRNIHLIETFIHSGNRAMWVYPLDSASIATLFSLTRVNANNNIGDGVYFQRNAALGGTVSYLKIIGGEFTNNGNAGIVLDGAIDEVLIEGADCSGQASGSSNVQNYGIDLVNYPTNVLVLGCNVRNNHLKPIYTDTYTSLGSGCQILNTLGFNPVGHISLPITSPFGTLPSAPTSGSTYLSPFPFPCTVYLNATTATSITVNVSGSASPITFNSASATVELQPGDSIQVTWTGGSVNWVWYGH